MTTTTATVPPAVRRRRRPWIGPLMLLVGVFVAFSLPPYLTLDPDLARIQPLPEAALYYPALVLHVVCGSIAITTCCFQIWPRFRNRHRRGHRLTGRVYALAGVLPGGLAGLYIGWNSPYGPTARVSAVMMAVLWLVVTTKAVTAARRRDFGTHRRWMIRSFALTMSIVINRIVGVPIGIVLGAQGYSAEEVPTGVATITTWLGWTLALIIAELWLERDVGRRARGPAVGA